MTRQKPKEPLTVYLETEKSKKLVESAAREGKSAAEVIVELVDSYLED